MKFYVFLLLTAFSLSGCIAGKGDVKIDIKNRKSKTSSPSTITSASVSSVQIINNQLVITGAGLTDVINVKIDGTSFNESFDIESKTTTQIVANSLNAFSFDVSKVFNLILSDASASATFPIDFSLCNATLNGKGFDCGVAAADKDVLSFDQATNKWKPRSINGLSYQGSWDATDPLPATTSAGDYFIVSVASTPYGVGDWIVWNGGNYDQINNSTTITSVYGRTGAIVATEGDYDLNKLLDVDLTVAPTAGKILKYDGAKWIAGDDLSGGGAGSVTSTEIADSAVTDAKIDTVSASKITGTITSSQILDGTIVNADINAAAAIDYSKLNIPNTTIPYAKLNIADGDIPAAKISGLPAATSVLAATIVDADTTHAPDGNAVFDALGLKLNLTGGTLSIGTISGVPTPTNSDDVANKGYTDTRDALKVSKAGDTMTGALTLDSNLLLKGGSNYVTVKGHATSATYDLILPINSGTSGYVLATDGSGNTSWVDVMSAVTGLDTDDVAEGTRLYFTEARVLATDLVGLNTGVAGPIVAADTVLGAMGKLQYHANSVQAFAKSALPTCAAGEVLKSNGTNFSCVVDNSGAAAFSGTASRAVVTDVGGALDVSATTSTELGYVSGVTSSIQTQLNTKEAAITAGTAAQYLNGEKNFVTLDTLAVPENTRLYFTEPRVLATDLTGFVATNSAIAATDTVLVGLEKSQGQITNLNTIKANVAGDTFTGDVTFNTQVRLKDGAAADHITIKAPASGTTSHTLTLPAAVGTSGQVLSMTGTAGVLAWTTPSSSAAPSGAAGGDLSGTYPNPTITGLDATKLATGVVDNTELNYLNGVTSSIQTQLIGKQAVDATLTSLAGHNTNGIMVQTAVDTFAGRSIAGTTNRVTVTNGDGVAGNPTLDIPTALLPSPVVGDVGKFLKVTAADTSVWSALSSSDITTALGFTPIDKAGDSITSGTFTFSGTAALRAPDPVVATDVANKQYVDSYGQWVKSGSDVYRSAGKVGVGTTTPQTALDVAGAVRLSDDATACAAANAGAIRYNSTLSLFEKCNGSQWFAESSGVPIPANAVVLMKACDASWTDLGTTGGGPGTAHCDGVNCHRCQGPASPSLVPANSIVLMESCPANWTSLGTTLPGGPASAGKNSLIYQSCQSPAAAVAIPQASRIMSDSCPVNWTDLGDTDTGPLLATCTVGVPCRVCEVPSGITGNGRLLYGGTGGATGSGGNVSVRGGAGGTTSGSGGSVSIRGGAPIDGAGGGISLVAANGATTTATSAAGGVITLTAGAGVSGGAGGNILVNSGVSDSGTQGHIILNNSNAATFVGVGTLTPQTKLDVSGSIRIGADATACSATIAGAMRFNTPNVEFCNGTTWAAFGMSGAAVASSQITDGTIVDADVNASANITATKLGTGAVDNTEFNYLDGVTSAIQTQLNGKQATDATLTALAGFNTNGIMVQTAADTFVGRSIAGTANRVTVTNGDGVAANPTVNISTTLLPSPVVGDVGKFLKATAADTSVWTALGSSDITTALGFTPINKAGDSLTTGTFTLSGAAVLRSPDPIGLTDVANKQYVDSYGQWTKSGSDVYRLTGNVGIGTNSPAVKLDMRNDTDGDLATYMFNSNATGISSRSIVLLGQGLAGNYGFLSHTGDAYSNAAVPNALPSQTILSGADTNGLMVASPNAPLRFSTGASPLYDIKMIIDNSGNVGIGTTTPTRKFHVSGNSGVSSPGIQIENTGTDGRGYSLVSTGNGNTLGDGKFAIYDETASLVRFILDSTGNVGIGTNAPESKLHINGSFQVTTGGSGYYGWGDSGPSNTLAATDLDYNRAAGNSIYRINNHTGISMSAHTSYGGIRFYNQGYEGGQSNPYLTTLVSPPTMVMALTNGRVGVGTTAPLSKFSIVKGSGGDQGTVEFRLGQNEASARDFIIRKDTSTPYGVEIVGSANPTIDAGFIAFKTSDQVSGEKMRITATGRVGIGTTAPDDKFVVNNGTTIGRYTASGWTHSSDARLKYDIFTLENSTDKLLKLRGVNYVLNSDPKNETQIGFIAQEVETIFPEVVKTDKAGFKSMVYANLIAPLVEGFKDLYKKITDIFVTTEKNSRAVASVDLKVKKLEEENAAKTKEIAQLKAYLCAKDPHAAICN